VHSSIEDRVDSKELRVSALQNLAQPIVKNAFDTRRMNQDTDFNPRRNLQHYHRSTPFISKDAGEQLKTFFKLKIAVDSIKEDFTGDSDWLDSYARILSTALDRTLRVEQKDMDFFQPQMDYLNEMLYLRYRLNEEDITKMSETELKSIILNKDEKLFHKQIFAKYNKNEIKKETIQQISEVVTGQQQEPKIVSNNNSNSIRNKDGDKEINITINVS
jgi:hypothetical protein